MIKKTRKTELKIAITVVIVQSEAQLVRFKKNFVIRFWQLS